MSTTTQEITSVDEFASQFERLENESDFAKSWFHPIRKAALARFVESGFPTLKHEEWRFTNIKKVVGTNWSAPDENAKVLPQGALEPFDIGETAATLVFVDGQFSIELSDTSKLTAGVEVARLSEALEKNAKQIEPFLGQVVAIKDDAFASLNTAFVQDGAFIRVTKNAVLNKPIHVIYASTQNDQPTASHPRTLIVAEDNAQATIVESFVGVDGGTYLTNAVLEAATGAGANIFHHKIVQESDNAYHFGTICVSLQRDSRFTSTNVCLGGALTRHNVESRLLGEGGQCTFNGLSMLHGEQLVDNHLRIEHAAAHCESWQYYKGIYDDTSRGVFAGRIFVHEGAQKTDAKQTNMSLLLSNTAQVDSKPQLEIFADDVKCTHGATIGQIDEEAVFYLRARGLNDKAARSLLVHAFANETLSELKVEPLRERLEAIVLERLPESKQ